MDNTTEVKKENNNGSNRLKHKALLDMIYVALFAAVICVCSLISINIGEVPITLQTFAVCAAAAMLGWKRGTLSVIIYILLGAIGLPVFAGGSGGFGIIAGSTGGYIVGFIFTALIVGFVADKFNRKIIALVIAMVVGILVCYAFGTPWFMFVTNMDLVTSLGYCVIPFLIPDAVKIIVATVLVNRLNKIVKL